MSALLSKKGNAEGKNPVWYYECVHWHFLLIAKTDFALYYA